MQIGRKCHPQQIRDIGIDNRAEFARSAPEEVKRPDESRKHKQDIKRGEQIILESKLNGGKGEVEDEVQRKWQCNHLGQLPFPHSVEYEAERDGDNDV